MKKFALTFILGLAIAGVIIHTIQGGSGTKTGGPGRRGPGVARVAVEITPIKVASLVDEGRFVGSLESKSKFMVAPKISGRLKKLLVDIGDSIDNGETVAFLDDEELLLSVKQAEADMEIARANFTESTELLEISQRELDRVKTMRQQKVSSEVDVENAQAAHKTRQARHQVNRALLSQKEAALETAKVRLSYARVTASWSDSNGSRFIAERFLNEGAMISANTPIVSVIDIATITAVIDAVEQDYFKLETGQMAEIEPSATPGRTYQARISRIAPMLDEASRQARIELELSNSDYQLKPGMFIRARIIFAKHNDATVVPASAMARRNEREGVFLIDHESEKANFIPIERGFTEGEFVEIASPSLSGDVVTLGHHLLEDGMAIILADKNRPAEKSEKKGKGPGATKGGRQP
ncbi:MAG: efflux RND transporter periplasmic adaptor subunit [Candidatus Riflebacteria bacterium HGW-Riflebacteria-2]|jgi:RND family efflux transporter MFP subunit|nr:MAG: efflux RND transporter periplasmic adaptor subunit [Candidatus Riflebacteria bacterium HGW-Riflebacteria-2]